VIQGRQHFGFVLETSHAIGVASECFGQNLKRDITLQLGITGPVDLAHAARPDKCEDLVRPETSASDKGHGDTTDSTLRSRAETILF
jgi:hypothetical protein